MQKNSQLIVDLFWKGTNQAFSAHYIIMTLQCMKRKQGIDRMNKRKGVLVEHQTEVKMSMDKTTRSNWYIQNNVYILIMDSRDGKSMVGNSEN